MTSQWRRWTGSFAIALAASWAFLTPTAVVAKADKPALILRVAALDTLIADVFHLAKVIGREDEVKQAETLLKNFTGPKGIEGLDTKKPWGVYGKIGPSGIDSEGVVLLPIANQKVFLEFLNKVGQKPEEKEGLYTLNVDSSPFPLFFRFHNGYLWGTLRDENSIAVKNLPDAAELLSPEKTGAMSLTFDFSAVPQQLRTMVLDKIDEGLKQAKEKAPANESETEKRGRLAGIDLSGELFKQVLTDGGETIAKIDLDRRNDEMLVEFSFAGKPGSTLAKNLASMGARKGLVASLPGSDSAYFVGFNIGLPESLAKLAADGFKQGFNDAMAKDPQNDPKKKELASKLYDILLPIFEKGIFDLGVDIRGPGPKNKYTIIGGIAVPDARKVEALIKQLRTDVPELATVIELDVAKSDKATYHRLAIDPLPKDIVQIVGNSPITLGFTADTVYFALGSESQKAIEEQTTKGFAAGPLIQADMRMNRMAPIFGIKEKAVLGAAKKAFDGKPNQDLFQTKVTSGDKLVFKMSMKTQVLAFFGALAPKDN